MMGDTASLSPTRDAQEDSMGATHWSCCCSTPATNLSLIPQLTSRKPPGTTFLECSLKQTGRFRLWLQQHQLEKAGSSISHTTCHTAAHLAQGNLP